MGNTSENIITQYDDSLNTPRRIDLPPSYIRKARQSKLLLSCMGNITAVLQYTVTGY